MKKINYKSECGKLIDFNTETNTYVVRNSISKKDKRISVDEFNLLNTTKIKHEEYCRLMNIYFKDIKDKWDYQWCEYRSLDNFEQKDGHFSLNYEIGKDVPFHDLNKPGENYYYLKNMILVYHWGKIYYHTISYGGYDQGQLIDSKTLKFVQWCKLKHCAPILNRQTGKIM